MAGGSNIFQDTHTVYFVYVSSFDMVWYDMVWYILMFFLWLIDQKPLRELCSYLSLVCWWFDLQPRIDLVPLLQCLFTCAMFCLIASVYWKWIWSFAVPPLFIIIICLLRCCWYHDKPLLRVLCSLPENLKKVWLFLSAFAVWHLWHCSLFAFGFVCGFYNDSSDFWLPLSRMIQFEPPQWFCTIIALSALLSVFSWNDWGLFAVSYPVYYVWLAFAPSATLFLLSCHWYRDKPCFC